MAKTTAGSQDSTGARGTVWALGHSPGSGLLQADGGWSGGDRRSPRSGQASSPLLVISGLSVWLASLGFLTAWHLGIVGQLPWQQMSSRSSVPASKGNKLSYDLAFEVTFAIGQQSRKFEGREYKPHFSIRGVSESFCRKGMSLGDTVEAVFGKSHLRL